MANKGERASGLSREKIAGMIDHTRLGPETTLKDVHVLCQEASEYGFASVCVPPCYVREAKLMLTDASSVVCTVIGFPHGNSHTSVKATETRIAINEGAEEVDMVLAVGLLKSGAFSAVEEDLRETVSACEGAARLKVILECCLLTDEEKRTACLIARDTGADYVKTSTGFSHGGATEKDVSLMHSIVGGILVSKHRGEYEPSRTRGE